MKHRSLWLLLSLAAGLSCVATTLARSGGDGAAAKPPSSPDPKVEAAMRACAAEQGATLPPPGRPSADGRRPDMAKFDACMTARGFPKPKGPPPQGGQAPAGGAQPPAG